MNCNHRTVWNESTQSWTAVSELAKGRTKGNGKVKKNVVATMMLLTLHSQLMPVVHAYTPNVSGTTVNNETLNTGEVQNVLSGGIANSTTVNSSGSQSVLDGGVTNGTIVNANGTQGVSSGGVANSTSVNTGGTMFVNDGGIALRYPGEFGKLLPNQFRRHR